MVLSWKIEFVNFIAMFEFNGDFSILSNNLQMNITRFLTSSKNLEILIKVVENSMAMALALMAVSIALITVIQMASTVIKSEMQTGIKRTKALLIMREHLKLMKITVSLFAFTSIFSVIFLITRASFFGFLSIGLLISGVLILLYSVLKLTIPV